MAEHDVAGEVHRLPSGKMSCELDHAMGVLARVQIRTADAAGQRPHQHLSRARLRLGHLIDDDLAIPENRCAHRRPALSFVAVFLSHIPGAKKER
jgi:hypothetical protein